MRINWNCITIAVALAISWLLLPGCSGHNPQTTPPVSIQDASPVNHSGGHQLWGYWLIGIDPNTNQYEIVPVRQVETHWNVIKWLEQDPCTDCFKITSFADSGYGTKLVTVSIKHPFPSMNLTGFDVRGIVMFNGSHLFPTSGLTISDKFLDDGELINADGYTTLYNSSTAGSGPGGLQGYLKGKFATAAMPNATLNGFKRFESDDPANTRNAFYAGDTIEQVFDIVMPDSPIIVGYAIDASWAPPTTKPVTDPMIDFPPEANCYEPYQLLVNVYGTLNEQAGMLKIEVAIKDHQGPGSYEKPLIECPELFDSALEPSSGGPDGYTTYICNIKHAPPGQYRLLISVEDNENSGADPWIDLTAYKIWPVYVQEDSGWARTWGGASWDRGNAVATDSIGNTYVAGIFQGTVDFDPGPLTEELSSINDSIDPFLSKFNSVGTFLWAMSWGGSGVDTANDVVVCDRLVVVGEFEDAADLDPSTWFDDKVSNGGSDAYAIELSLEDSNYLRGQTWGGTANDTATAAAYSSAYDRLMVTGSFRNSLQFPGGQSAISNGESDIYLVDITELHNLLGTYGGTGDDLGLGLAIQGDSLVNLVGAFQNDVNFGPFGTRHSAGSADAFLAPYDISADPTPVLQWVITWGDTGWDTANAVCVYPGHIYITGSFQGTVDYDPGGNTDTRTASGFGDAYICHYGSAGTYTGVQAWGGDDGLAIDSGEDIAADNDGNVYVAGAFFGSTFGIPSNGSFDAIVIGWGGDLTLNWAETFGGTGSDGANSIAIDYWNRIFSTGGYRDTVDFDPTSEVDEHTYNGGQSDCFLEKQYSNGQW